MLSTSWANFPVSFQVHKEDGKTEVFEVGSIVHFKGRQDTGVLVTSILGDESGPMGFTYLPWRDDLKRWATLQMSLRGDPRFIVCYPKGNQVYGMHIDWNTIRKVDHADAELPEFQAFVETVKKKQTVR